MTDPQDRMLESQISADLVERIGNGDDNAEKEMCERYYQRLLYFLSKRVGGDTALAQDICQQTFLKCLQKLRNRDIRNAESLAAYLHGIAIHDLKNENRKAQRRATEPDAELIENAANREPGPIERISDEQLHIELRNCLNGLSPHDRNVLIRLYFHGEDRASICASEGYSPKQLNNIVWRAKQRLKKQIVDAADEGAQLHPQVVSLMR